MMMHLNLSPYRLSLLCFIVIVSKCGDIEEKHQQESYNPEEPSLEVSKHYGSIFSSLPFLPRPEFKPERYIRTRSKRSKTLRKTVSANSNEMIALQCQNNTDAVQFVLQRAYANVSDVFTAYKPITIPYPGPVRGATVIPIIFGSYTSQQHSLKFTAKDPIDLMGTAQVIFSILLGFSHLFSSSVTLIRDKKDSDKCNILVDTGPAVFKNALVKGLQAQNLRPADIKYLVLTHYDIDSIGNLDLFLDAQAYFANRKVLRRIFQDLEKSLNTEQIELPTFSLCDNTEIYLTPGYSPTDLSVIVKNVQDFGNIAIVGNLIFDDDDENVWQQFVYDDENISSLWLKARKEIFCLADYIIPGHGSIFKVSYEKKLKVGCVKNQVHIPPQ